MYSNKPYLRKILIEAFPNFNHVNLDDLASRAGLTKHQVGCSIGPDLMCFGNRVWTIDGRLFRELDKTDKV